MDSFESRLRKIAANKPTKDEPQEGVEALGDWQLLDMYMRGGGSLAHNLTLWAEAAQQEHDPGRSTVFKDLFVNIQKDINELTNSLRGSRMDFDKVAEYVATKMRRAKRF